MSGGNISTRRQRTPGRRPDRPYQIGARRSSSSIRPGGMDCRRSSRAGSTASGCPMSRSIPAGSGGHIRPQHAAYQEDRRGDDLRRQLVAVEMGRRGPAATHLAARHPHALPSALPHALTWRSTSMDTVSAESPHRYLETVRAPDREALSGARSRRSAGPGSVSPARRSSALQLGSGTRRRCPRRARARRRRLAARKPTLLPQS